MPGVSIMGLDFNHRSTGVKPVGAWMNHKPGSGAKSTLHRRKVGGGDPVGAILKAYP